MVARAAAAEVDLEAMAARAAEALMAKVVALVDLVVVVAMVFLEVVMVVAGSAAHSRRNRFQMRINLRLRAPHGDPRPLSHHLRKFERAASIGTEPLPCMHLSIS